MGSVSSRNVTFPAKQKEWRTISLPFYLASLRTQVGHRNQSRSHRNNSNDLEHLLKDTKLLKFVHLTFQSVIRKCKQIKQFNRHRDEKLI